MFHEFLALGNAVNLAIVSLLILIYYRNLRNIRSSHNVGLLLFSLMFFIENLLMLHLAIFQWPIIVSEIVVLHMFLINTIETLGLLILLVITWK